MSEPNDEGSSEKKPIDSKTVINGPAPVEAKESSQAKVVTAPAGETDNEMSLSEEKEPTKGMAKDEASATVVAAIKESSTKVAKPEKSVKKKKKSADAKSASKETSKKAQKSCEKKKKPKSGDSRHSSQQAKSKEQLNKKEHVDKLQRSKSKDSKQSQSTDSKMSTASKSSKATKDVKLSKRKNVDLSKVKIGFVGAGKMSEAIVRGLLTVGKIDPGKIYVAGKSGKNLDDFSTRGVTVTKRSYDIFGKYNCDVIFLAVHGFVIRACFKGGGSRPFAFTVNYIPNQQKPIFVLSLIGGVSLRDIRLTMLDPDQPEKYLLSMHRIMVNVGVRYGLGLGAIDVEPDSKHCNPLVRQLLSSITKIEFFPEAMMDPLCAIGGNGLAFVYYFISSLASGGFKMGLNKVMATRLATRALQSAAQCLLESGKHPSELQDAVTSQGGPAIYGLHVLEQADCASGFQNAVEGAYRRLRELIDIEPVTQTEALPFMF